MFGGIRSQRIFDEERFCLERDRVATTDRETFATPCWRTLTRPRAIPAKFLYDGARLGAVRTRSVSSGILPARTETAILRARAAEIASLRTPKSVLIEFGAGSSVKSRCCSMRWSWDSTRDRHLHASISKGPPSVCAAISAHRHRTGLRDYMALDALPGITDTGHRLGFFPRLEHRQSRAHEAVPSCVAPPPAGRRGRAVLGTDSRRIMAGSMPPITTLAGVTAPSRSISCRAMNRELHATFDLRALHTRHFQIRRGQARSTPQPARPVGDRGRPLLRLADGERIHTNFLQIRSRGLAGDWRATAASGSIGPGRPRCLFAVSYLRR